MKRLIAVLWFSLAAGAVFAQEKLKLEIVNASPLARIEAAPLHIDDARRKVSLSVVVKNTGEKAVRKVFLEFKFKGQVRGYAIDTSAQGEGIEVHLPPNEKRSICIADDADLPPALGGMSSGEVSIIRIEFDDGTAWERPNQRKG